MRQHVQDAYMIYSGRPVYIFSIAVHNALGCLEGECMCLITELGLLFRMAEIDLW
jgi:hypothetical protein